MRLIVTTVALLLIGCSSPLETDGEADPGEGGGLPCGFEMTEMGCHGYPAPGLGIVPVDECASGFAFFVEGESACEAVDGTGTYLEYRATCSC